MTREEILKDDWVANNYGDRGRNWVNLAFLDGVNWMEEKMQESNEGQALLYAVAKTAERTKREVIEKAAEWFEKYLFDIGYPDDWCRDSKNLISGRDKFIKAMNK